LRFVKERRDGSDCSAFRRRDFKWEKWEIREIPHEFARSGVEKLGKSETDQRAPGRNVAFHGGQKRKKGPFVTPFVMGSLGLLV
jgi:hypothetical protein